MKWNILEIEKDVKEALSEYRYKHSLNVMEEAASLAKHYKASKDDIEKCKVCGLTHDLCKELTEEENEQLVKKYNLPRELLSKENKNLIHGFLASVIVKEKYNFDEDMVLAIRYHTTGYPNMDLLAKIIYLADKIEKNKNYPGIEQERLLAYQDIDEAIILCLKNQIKKLTGENKKINKMAYDTLEYLENIKSK